MLDEIEHLIHRHTPGLRGELRDGLGAEFVAERIRIGLHDEQIAEVRDEVAEQPAQVLAALGLPMHHGERARGFARDDVVAQLGDCVLRGEAEDVQHVGVVDLLAAEGHELIEHRLGVAQPALCAARDRVRGVG